MSTRSKRRLSLWFSCIFYKGHGYFGGSFVLFMWCTRVNLTSCLMPVNFYWCINMVNVNMDVRCMWEHGCFSNWLHVLMHFLCIYMNCVRYGIKNRGGSVQILFFRNKSRRNFELKSGRWPNYGVSIGRLTMTKYEKLLQLSFFIVVFCYIMHQG